MTIMSSISGADAYKPFLEQIAVSARKYGEGLQSPCEPESVADLQLRAREQLGAELPPGYAEFLSLHNGLDWDGLVIYSCTTVPIVGHEDRFIEGFVESNLGYRDNDRMKRFLVLGDSDMYLYVYEAQAREFSVIDRVSLDRHEVFATFEEMLAAALRTRVE
ncbi:YrhA family protein [Hyalangium gracile]|uniref:YrhA family protein n=1 Tax=Hyalangium gracile TaxID=394092 RepID=UPI001CCD65B4|nr:YrhA family protein [Hyalangium gracile]